MNISLKDLFAKNIDSFKNLWPGGYLEGNPLDPISPSQGYGELGYMSILHVVYLACIKSYVTEKSIVLEIGPGRGAWTKTFLHAKEIWCLDVLSAEKNHFWEYVGAHNHIKYLQVRDFSCSELPDNKFDYFFSFGTFCHIPFEGMKEYMKNLFPKFKQGTQCFLMFMDYNKYNAAWEKREYLSIYRIFSSGKKIYIKRLMDLLHSIRMHNKKYREKFYSYTRRALNEDNIPRPGRLYNIGIKETAEMLENIGYKVIDPDMEVLNRDPLIHFMKP